MLASATLTSLLKVLGDPTRLRMLALIEREELSVGEVSRALGMSQSRVSNHLRVLRDLNLLGERRMGSSRFLHLALGDGAGNGTFARDLWQTLSPEVALLPDHAADLQRLEAVLAERGTSSADFFDRVAADWDKIGLDFESGQARHRAAARLMPSDLVFGDLGCGTGYLARALVGLCRRLVCVDRSEEMLKRAREKLDRAPLSGTEVEFRQGQMDQLPLADGELDGLVAGMVLHHLADLERPAAEMRRVLRPGGSACVLELAPHSQEWMREAQGDRFLGLDSADVMAALERAGFRDLTLEVPDDHYAPPLPPAAGAPTGTSGGVDSAGQRARLPLYLVRARAPR
jgi:ubiquinone/menaquinone biosynthesis C-methylase UbiE/DNA-binding transcriptional ArsR family regulator